MKNIAVQIVFFIGALCGLFKFLDAWLSKDQKSKLHKKAVELWFNLRNQDAMVVVKAPLQIASDLFDELCGHRIISWKAFLRYSIFSICYLVCALSVTGIRTGTLLGVSPSPGESFEQSFGIVRVAIQTMRNNIVGRLKQLV